MLSTCLGPDPLSFIGWLARLAFRAGQASCRAWGPSSKIQTFFLRFSFWSLTFFLRFTRNHENVFFTFQDPPQNVFFTFQVEPGNVFFTFHGFRGKTFFLRFSLRGTSGYPRARDQGQGSVPTVICLAADSAGLLPKGTPAFWHQAQQKFVRCQLGWGVHKRVLWTPPRGDSIWSIFHHLVDLSPFGRQICTTVQLNQLILMFFHQICTTVQLKQLILILFNQIRTSV